MNFGGCNLLEKPVIWVTCSRKFNTVAPWLSVGGSAGLTRAQHHAHVTDTSQSPQPLHPAVGSSTMRNKKASPPVTPCCRQAWKLQVTVRSAASGPTSSSTPLAGKFKVYIQAAGVVTEHIQLHASSDNHRPGQLCGSLYLVPQWEPAPETSALLCLGRLLTPHLHSTAPPAEDKGPVSDPTPPANSGCRCSSVRDGPHKVSSTCWTDRAAVRPRRLSSPCRSGRRSQPSLPSAPVTTACDGVCHTPDGFVLI